MTRRLCAALKGIFVPGVVLKIFVRGVERKDNPQLVHRLCAPCTALDVDKTVSDCATKEEDSGAKGCFAHIGNYLK